VLFRDLFPKKLVEWGTKVQVTEKGTNSSTLGLQFRIIQDTHAFLYKIQF